MIIATWPLRWKLTLWTAALVGGVVAAIGFLSSWHLYHEGLEDLQHNITAEAKVFSHSLRKEQEESGNSAAAAREAPFLSPSYLVEVFANDGTAIYRSEKLGSTALPHDFPPKTFTTALLGGKRMRVGAFRDHDISFYLAAPMHGVEEVRSDLLRCYLVTAPAVFALVALGGWFIARRGLAPIEEIAAAAETISVKRLDQRLPVPSTNDEVARLTTVLNKMIDRLEGSFRQATRFTADASHELKTPLTVIRGELEAALRTEDLPSPHEKRLLNLLDETKRLTQIVERLLLLSRADGAGLELELEPLDLSNFVAEFVEDIEIIAAPHGVSVVAEIQPGCMVNANPQFLRQLCLNLLDNSVKYNREHGRVVISVGCESSSCRLRVGNSGMRIGAAEAAHVFDRFYRGDAARGNRRSGQGLGLSLCREIARAHGGEIVLSRSDEDWTEFTVSFPASRPKGDGKKSTGTIPMPSSSM